MKSFWISYFSDPLKWYFLLALWLIPTILILALSPINPTKAAASFSLGFWITNPIAYYLFSYRK